jgi:hypothetical protein
MQERTSESTRAEEEIVPALRREICEYQVDYKGLVGLAL